MASAALTDEFLLLAHPIKRPLGWHGGLLATGAAGAALGELTLTGRVALDGDGLVVVDPRPLAHPLLDAMLADVGAGNRPAPWVHRWAQRAYAHTRDDLLRSGGFLRDKGRRLWFPTQVTRVVADHPDRVAALARLDRMAEGVTTADGRTTTLAGMLGVVSGVRGFPGRRERRFEASAFKDAGRDDWLAQTLRRAMRMSTD